MTDIDLKNALLAGDPNAGEETEEVKTHAGVVVVRSLSRSEVLGLQDLKKRAKLSIAQFEAHMVSKGIVSPTMSVAEVETWQSVDKANGSLAEVTNVIARISGLDEGASKSGVSGPAQQA